MQLPPRFNASSHWSFIPGPVDQSQPMSSVNLRSIVELSADTVADSFLSFPGMRLTHPAEPDWWAWRARWESASDFIALGFTLFDHRAGIWGGSEFDADCPSSAVLSLLHHMHQRHGGIWLHAPDCGMHAYQQIPK